MQNSCLEKNSTLTFKRSLETTNKAIISLNVRHQWNQPITQFQFQLSGVTNPDIRYYKLKNRPNGNINITTSHINHKKIFALAWGLFWGQFNVFPCFCRFLFRCRCMVRLHFTLHYISKVGSQPTIKPKEVWTEWLKLHLSRITSLNGNSVFFCKLSIFRNLLLENFAQICNKTS